MEPFLDLIFRMWVRLLSNGGKIGKCVAVFMLSGDVGDVGDVTPEVDDVV